MSDSKQAKYTRPEEINTGTASNVLASLNTTRSSEELAAIIEISGERDIGQKVAQNIIARRTQLGGFKDLSQVLAVPQVGPERFTEIVRTLSERKEPLASYTIEGQLKGTTSLNFRQNKLVVCAYIGGVEVARADVNENGKYRLNFKHAEVPSNAELRVLPAKFAQRAARTTAMSKTMSASRYKLQHKSIAYYAAYDIMIPKDYLIFWSTVTKTYHMHGAVYATTFAGGIPISIEPLPAAKIEFYEVDTPIIWLFGTDPVLTEAYLGYAYTAPDGSYDFEFDFSYKNSPWIWLWLFTDKKPDIRARISQFVSGVWQQVYEGPVDWDIVDDFHRDYFVPVEDTIPVPDAGIKPDEGFRFVSLGLIPIDNVRFQLGYATAQPGDPAPIAGVKHQPFCGTLRIFGLFAEAPPVATCKVQIAEADEFGATGSWNDLTDTLTNRKWNNTLHVWEPLNLGPDPVTGKYQNIDTEPEADWHEHALKVTWNSLNYPNGFYALRVIGYDAANTEVGTFGMPVIRTDNSVPDAKLEIVGTSVGGVTPCGSLQLGADRGIQFKVTAHDPEGHVKQYWLSGTRGKEAFSAGITISESRPDPTSNWTGVNNKSVTFTATTLPISLILCSMLAYNFELHVWGLSTDGYNATPGSQRAKKESNLIVSEP
ncbi:MAG: helix-hairpin-helix domain-containing protein [Dehalococcoidales bacterium]|nr:helix-hairpin-helix domain-containing protein [Dehalococcoidales bacterium]